MRKSTSSQVALGTALVVLSLGAAIPVRHARAQKEAKAEEKAAEKKTDAPKEKADAAKSENKKSEADDNGMEPMPAEAAEDAVTETTIKKERYASVGTGKKGPRLPCPVQSTEEVQVLLHLRERHTVLLARESELAQREAHLKAFEATLRERMAHVTVALGQIEQQLALGAEGEKLKEQRLQGLVDTVSKLSAKKAAPMLSQAEPEIVADLFRRLGPSRASALLAVMPPAKAGKLIDYAAQGADAAAKSNTQAPRGN